MKKNLEINLKGISNQEEFDINMKEIDAHSNVRIKKMLNNIIKNKKYSKKDIERLISLSKWTSGERSKDCFNGKYNKGE